MTFWTWLIAVAAASVLVIIGLSLNGKTEHAGGHDDHGHDDHGHGGHGHGHH